MTPSFVLSLPSGSDDSVNGTRPTWLDVRNVSVGKCAQAGDDFGMCVPCRLYVRVSTLLIHT
jgi:hypothetical protein